MSSRAAVARNATSVQKLVRMLHDAVAAQHAGQIETAAKLYAAVLRERPDEFNALHMLGLIDYPSADACPTRSGGSRPR